MKTKNILLGIVILFSIFFGVNANSSEEGKFCGGIAAFQCSDGYSCVLDGTYPDAGGTCRAEKPFACTMEYVPVCGEIEIQCITTPCNNIKETFSNKCVAENSNAINIISGECIVKSKLSINEVTFYNTIKDRLDEKYQTRVNNTVEKYLKILEKYVISRKENINNKIIDALELKISYLLLQHPQDEALPKTANDIYYILTLFKFELMKLNF